MTNTSIPNALIVVQHLLDGVYTETLAERGGA
jgi:hypothetical protein